MQVGAPLSKVGAIILEKERADAAFHLLSHITFLAPFLAHYLPLSSPSSQIIIPLHHSAFIFPPNTLSSKASSFLIISNFDPKRQAFKTPYSGHSCDFVYQDALQVDHHALFGTVLPFFLRPTGQLFLMEAANAF